MFFMLSKEENDGMNSDCAISFPELSYYLYPHQLYGAFIMMIKEQGSSGEEYLENEMKVSKTTVAFMI